MHFNNLKQIFIVLSCVSRRGFNSTKSIDTILPVDKIILIRISTSSIVSPFGSGTPVPRAMIESRQSISILRCI